MIDGIPWAVRFCCCCGCMDRCFGIDGSGGGYSGDGGSFGGGATR